jgi:hypothetical protein
MTHFTPCTHLQTQPGMAHGAKPGLLLQDGMTALHVASAGHKEVVLQLLGAGAAVNAPINVRPFASRRGVDVATIQ